MRIGPGCGEVILSVLVDGLQNQMFPCWLDVQEYILFSFASGMYRLDNFHQKNFRIPRQWRNILTYYGFRLKKTAAAM